jgi:hypothetical protein
MSKKYTPHWESVLGKQKPFSVTPYTPIDFASLSIASLKPLATPVSSAPPVETAVVEGYWRGDSGSLLRFRRASGSDRIDVTGTALNQKVQGHGTIEGARLKIRVMLQVKRIELTLDLAMPTCGSDSDADRLTGTASDGTGADRLAQFSRLAVDVEGTWQEGNESSLSFEQPVLDWFDGKQEVRLGVTGYIFGRQGKGTLQSWHGRHVSGIFRAEDYSHHNDFLDKHLFNHNWKELYERVCPKEGWWAAETLYLKLDVSADGSLMAGTVKPMGRRDDSEQIETHVHLVRRARQDSARAPQSMF